MRHARAILGLLFVSLAFTLPARAEDVRLGFLVGTNLARLGTDPDIDASTDSNFLLGGFAEFGLNENFFIEPQLRYIEKGADVSRYVALPAGSDAEVSLTMKYLEVPLHFKWKWRAGEVFRPYAFLGPYLGFKIGDSTTYTSRSSGLPVNVGGPLGGDLRSVDFGAELGGGAEFFFSDAFSARLGIAYARGLVDVNQTAANWKTRGLQVFAGLSFLN